MKHSVFDNEFSKALTPVLQLVYKFIICIFRYFHLKRRIEAQITVLLTKRSTVTSIYKTVILKQSREMQTLSIRRFIVNIGKANTKSLKVYNVHDCILTV